MARFFTDKNFVALKEETTEGTFEQPLAGDMAFPLGSEMFTPELGLTEGLSDALGKHTQPRFFPSRTGIVGNLMSYLMSATNPASLDGELEIAPLFEMAGFNLDTTQTNLALVWDGSGNCKAFSAIALNAGCADATTGYCFKVRGARASIEIDVAEAGAVFDVKAPVSGAVEEEGQAIPIVAKEYANDAGRREVEQFLGSLVFDGVATPVEKMTIALNGQFKKVGQPNATGGVETVITTTYDPKVSITVPVGTATANWWTNALTGKVISELKYTGTYFDITVSDLSITSHTNADSEGEVALTQELNFGAIRIEAK